MRKTLVILSTSMILSGCSGIFDNIYDEPPVDTSFTEGFSSDAVGNRRILRLDARSYDEWIFIDLHNNKLDRLPLAKTLTGEWDGTSAIAYRFLNGNVYEFLRDIPADTQVEPEVWDLAIHHFDVRTNGGAVSLAGSDDFVEDVWSDCQVIVDLSDMMSYRIGFQKSMINPLLCEWVKMDLSSPPPTYSASGKTYILRMKDGTKASLKLLDYMSDRGTKGFLTIEINYPL